MSTISHELQRKYEEERSKRMRSDGMSQFVDVSTEHKDLNKDPWINYEELELNRPLKDGDEIKFLVIGAGHGGLLAAVCLIQAGFSADDIVLVDRAGGYGGTWYWNRYPGLTCDVEGYIYLPLLDETGYMPKHRYSEGQEIRENAERIARTWGLKGLFGTTVNSLGWSEADARWHVQMTQDRGPGKEERKMSVRAQFLYAATGVVDSPHLPRLPGFDDFRKNHAVFHTARWDYDVTGGSQKNPELTNLVGKNVGIIGTGATSVQVVPQLAKWAKHLYVFQRTPSYVGTRTQKLTDAETWAEVADGPGWQKRRQENYNAVTSREPVEEDKVNDGWSMSFGFAGIGGGANKGIITPDKVTEHVAEMLAMDTTTGENLRKHIEKEVRDKETAEKLKPWYYGWCKRPTFHQDYLASFNRDNVTLVDTDGKGVERYSSSGIVANASQSPAAGGRMSLIGRNGISLDEKWKPGSFGSLHGVATNGFPNLFFYTPANATVASNLTYSLDLAATHCAYIVKEAMRRTGGSGKTVVEVKKEAEDAWCTEVAKRAGWFAIWDTCTPGYLTKEGELTKKKTPEEQNKESRMAVWGGGLNNYGKVTEAYRASGNLDGIQVSA
ncbi:cyclohexanone 1,2-monooxygenase [Macrophomina phaseolina]|uniref:Cyclohexanone 1,2-monooxygenase n=1 Tax=Macrophomina phaseolina TaxID=35725 RepID=A0ABQ8FY17_9PEZI|nr:cyclohexanone 1,2-monooxygenase [Macrophomina phaseolina]